MFKNDFGHFFSLNGMNAIFRLKIQKKYIFFAAGCCPNNLASA